MMSSQRESYLHDRYVDETRSYSADRHWEDGQWRSLDRRYWQTRWAGSHLIYQKEIEQFNNPRNVESMSSANDNEDNSKSMAGVFSKFAERTSMVGVGYINSSKSRLAKLIWTVLLLASLVALTLHLKYLFDIYYGWPKQTKVVLGFSALNFPAVTICNVNPLRKSQLYMTSPELRRLVYEFSPENMAKRVEDVQDQIESQRLEDDEENGVNTSEANLNIPFLPFGFKDWIEIKSNNTGETNTEGNSQSKETTSHTKNKKDVSTSTQPTILIGDDNGQEKRKPKADQSTPSNKVTDQPIDIIKRSTLETTTNLPLNTTTRKPLDTATRKPLDTATRKPLDTSTRKPLDTTTRKPLDTATRKPLDTATRKPLDTTTRKPLDTATRKPLDTTTRKPLDTATRKPLDTATHKPLDTKTTKPSDITTDKPLETKTRKPIGIKTDKLPDLVTHPPSDTKTRSPPKTKKPKLKKKTPLTLLSKLDLNITNLRNKMGAEMKTSDLNQTVYDPTEMLFTERSATADMIDEFRYLFSNISRDTRIAAGHQMGDMLVDCSFDGRQCQSEHFSLVTSSTFGNCFTIDHRRLVSSRSGPTGGLQVILYLENDEYLRGITTGNGGQVVVHESNTTPFPEDDGLALMAGAEINIALRMMRISRLGHPHGECEPGKQFEETFGVVYTRQTCQAFCEQSLIVESCGCYDDEKEELNRAIKSVTLPGCRNRIQVVCMLNTSRHFEQGKLHCDCENPCIEIRYEKMLSLRQWPSDEYAVLLVESLCKTKNKTECNKLRSMDNRKLSNSFMKLNIYYEDLNYQNITEEPDYEFVQFASDVGGTIGLWVGLCLLSLFEVLQFLMELGKHFLFGSCCKTRQKSKQPSSRPKSHANLSDNPLTMNVEDKRSSHFSGY